MAKVYATLIMKGKKTLDDVPALLKSGCTVWYCDIKKFKYFNDLFGYEQGDALLRDFSAVVKASLEKDELFCRVSILLISMPVFLALLETLQGFLG